MAAIGAASHSRSVATAVRRPAVPGARLRRRRLDHRGLLRICWSAGPARKPPASGRRDITVGRTVRLADRIGAHPPRQPPRRRSTRSAIRATRPGSSTRKGRLLTPPSSRGVPLTEVPGRRTAIATALRGSRTVEQLPGGVTVASAPVFREGRLVGRRPGARRAAGGDPAAHRGDPRRPPHRRRDRRRGRRRDRLPDRQRDHLARQAAGRQRRPDHRGQARRAARGHRRAGRDHRPRDGARDDAASRCARPSARSRPSATACRRSSTRSTTR